MEVDEHGAISSRARQQLVISLRLTAINLHCHENVKYFLLRISQFSSRHTLQKN